MLKFALLGVLYGLILPVQISSTIISHKIYKRSKASDESSQDVNQAQFKLQSISQQPIERGRLMFEYHTPVYISGQGPCWLLIDTGSSTTVIASSLCLSGCEMLPQPLFTPSQISPLKTVYGTY